MNNLPVVLYHGSHYDQRELQPGFNHSGIEVRWDYTESNKFLYTTTDKEAAINLGISSAVEKNFKLKSFNTDGNMITYKFQEPTVKLEDIFNLDVYLYTIKPDSKDGWIKNNNLHNNIDTEYKTKNIIQISSKEKINVRDFYSKYNVSIESHRKLFRFW